MAKRRRKRGKCITKKKLASWKKKCNKWCENVLPAYKRTCKNACMRAKKRKSRCK